MPQNVGEGHNASPSWSCSLTKYIEVEETRVTLRLIPWKVSAFLVAASGIEHNYWTNWDSIVGEQHEIACTATPCNVGTNMSSQPTLRNMEPHIVGEFPYVRQDSYSLAWLYSTIGQLQ